MNKMKIMENNNWDFIDNCDENQINLIYDNLTEEIKSRLPQNITDKKKTNDFLSKKTAIIDVFNDEYGEYNTFLLKAKSRPSYYGKRDVESLERGILMEYQKKLVDDSPQSYIKSYNLTANTTNDVMCEIESRYDSSNSFRMSLPYMIVNSFAQPNPFDKVSKYAVNAGTAAGVALLAAMMGPVGWALGGIAATTAFLYNNKRKKEEKSNDNDLYKTDEPLLRLACVLIMLRREKEFMFLDWETASNSLDNFFSNRHYDVNEIFYVLMKILEFSGPDGKTRYDKLIKRFSLDMSEMRKRSMLPDNFFSCLEQFKREIVERYYPYFRAQTSSLENTDKSVFSNFIYDKKKCVLLQDYSFPNSTINSNIDVIVNKENVKYVSLYLELIGYNSQEKCVYEPTKKYDMIQIYDESFEEKYHSFLNDGGCFCYTKKKEVSKESDTKALMDENKELKKQIEEFKNKEVMLLNMCSLYRHNQQPYIGEINDKISYIKESVCKGNVDVNALMIDIVDAENSVNNISENIKKFRNYTKDQEIKNCNIWDLLKQSMCELEYKYNVVWNNFCNDDCYTCTIPSLLTEAVFNNIKSNIEKHAFPNTICKTENNKIWISMLKFIDKDDNQEYYQIEISNNGNPFGGTIDDIAVIFDENKKFGNTGNTGSGLYLAKYFIENVHGGVIKCLLPNSETDEFSIKFIITIPKLNKHEDIQDIVA